jgi:hypothetical protein
MGSVLDGTAGERQNIETGWLLRMCFRGTTGT